MGNSMAQIHANRVIHHKTHLIGQFHQREDTLDVGKHEEWGYLHLSHSQRKHKSHITNCHAGTPCVHICDPTSQSRYPMIGMNKGWRFKGACKSAQPLEGSLSSYKSFWKVSQSWKGSQGLNWLISDKPEQ
ncbi:hypothetical protein Tco_0162093 [Tanacetum coccineum]